jgi:cell division inhibitor SepF
MKYLGLVEEDEFDEVEEAGSMARAADEVEPSHRPNSGGLSRRSRRAEHPAVAPVPDSPDSLIRTIPKSRPSSGTIHRAEPKRFNEARELGERFKDAVPVIMNLQQTEDSIARRLVDFASGLVFAHDGKIELVANRVYLLTPADVEVSAEERERLREGGFYNQF